MLFVRKTGLFDLEKPSKRDQKVLIDRLVRLLTGLFVQSPVTPYRQALVLAEELGMRPLQAHCHYGLGRLYAKMGRREQSRAELSTALEMYRSMEMVFWLPQTEAALAQMEAR
jgi:hypothetical protein